MSLTKCDRLCQTLRRRFITMQSLNSETIVEYLEKYAVAPSPSRDYYGIKVLKDQVILYIWKISHGPHKNPIQRVARFCDFNHDKTMQNDIQRIFGDHLFQHVRKIVQGKKGSLLTLPKNLIKKITGYLKLEDVLKLSKVSRMANEVFDADGVWEVLYKQYKMGLVYRDEREKGASHGWKKIFKERQLHKPARDRKLKKTSSSDHRLLSQPIRATLTRPLTAGVNLPLKNRTLPTPSVKPFRRKEVKKVDPKSGGSKSEIDYKNSRTKLGREYISPRIAKSGVKIIKDPGDSLISVKKMVKKITPREKVRTSRTELIDKNDEKTSVKLQENIEMRSENSLHGAKKIQSTMPVEKIHEIDAKRKTDDKHRHPRIWGEKNYSGIHLDAKEDFGLDDLIRESMTDKSLARERISCSSSREEKSIEIRRKFPAPRKPGRAFGEGVKNACRETEIIGKKLRECGEKFLSKGDCEVKKLSKIKSVPMREKIVTADVTKISKPRDLRGIEKSCEKFEPKSNKRC